MSADTTMQRRTALTEPLMMGGIAISAPMWEVRCQVLRTDYTHTWRGTAADSRDARNRAHDDARRHWPGFSFCVRSVLQVA